MGKTDFFFDPESLRDLKGQTVRGGVITAVGQALQLVIQFASIPILGRLLSPEDFGLVAMVTFATGFARLFVDAGLSMATVQRENITHQQVSNLFWVATALGSLLAVILAAGAPLIALFYNEPRLTAIALVQAVSFVLSGLAVQHQALLRRTMNFRAMAATHFFAVLVTQGSAILLAWWLGNYWAIVFMPITNSGTRVLVSWTLCPWRPTWPRREAGVGQMVSFGMNVMGFNFIKYLSNSVDQMLIGWYWGAVPLGAYERAYRMLIFPLRQIQGPVSGVSIPALSRLQDKPIRYRNAYLQIVNRMLCLTCPFITYLAFTAPWFVALMLGPQWTEAVGIFRWLTLAGLTQLFVIICSWALISQNRGRDLFRWAILGAIPSLVSFLVGLPWGPIGVARAYGLISLVVTLPLLLWWTGRRGPVSTLDLWRSVRDVIPHVLAVAATNAVFLAFVEIERSAIGLLATLLLSALAWLLTSLATQSGRALLSEVYGVLLAAWRNYVHRRNSP